MRRQQPLQVHVSFALQLNRNISVKPCCVQDVSRPCVQEVPNVSSGNNDQLIAKPRRAAQHAEPLEHVNSQSFGIFTAFDRSPEARWLKR